MSENEKDMLKRTPDNEEEKAAGAEDRESSGEKYDKMIEDLVHVESMPSDEMPVIPLSDHGNSF